MLQYLHVANVMGNKNWWREKPRAYGWLLPGYRQGKPRNRPSFRQILLHLDIASADVLGAPQETYFKSQVRLYKHQHCTHSIACHDEELRLKMYNFISGAQRVAGNKSWLRIEVRTFLLGLCDFPLCFVVVGLSIGQFTYIVVRPLLAMSNLVDQMLNHYMFLSGRVEGGSEKAFWEDKKWRNMHPPPGRGTNSAQERWTQVSH